MQNSKDSHHDRWLMFYAQILHNLACSSWYSMVRESFFFVDVPSRQWGEHDCSTSALRGLKTLVIRHHQSDGKRKFDSSLQTSKTSIANKTAWLRSMSDRVDHLCPVNKWHSDRFLFKDKNEHEKTFTCMKAIQKSVLFYLFVARRQKKRLFPNEKMRTRQKKRKRETKRKRKNICMYIYTYMAEKQRRKQN